MDKVTWWAMLFQFTTLFTAGLIRNKSYHNPFFILVSLSHNCTHTVLHTSSQALMCVALHTSLSTPLLLRLKLPSIFLSVHIVKHLSVPKTFVFYWYRANVNDYCCNMRSMLMRHHKTWKSPVLIDFIWLDVNDDGCSFPSQWNAKLAVLLF